MIYGYARVSTSEQSTKLQLAAFHKNGINHFFEEKQSSIKRRPVLENLISNVLKPGDTLCVYKIDRLARSMSHFVRIFEQLRAKEVGFRSLTESIETVTPQGRMFLQLLGVFAEFERELIRERCMAGQIAARARGQTWGKKPVLSPGDSAKVADMWHWGFEQSLLADMFGMSVAGLRDSIHRVEKRGRWRLSPSDR
ncbi:recombinase family protein [Rhodoferax ferrireducens]|uniref:recombinase family protein n=1 Tax=Rhodoferax ferrireducens TaxID=192843 RepID=UPI000E0DED06|nr:recombinase family protein [Rhodoferax ferrireducens]